MPPAQFQIRSRIVPTGQKLPYPQARTAVADKGGLPPHRLLDRHLFDKRYRGSLPPEKLHEIDVAFPLLAAELYIHPPSGQRLVSGRDIGGLLSSRLLPWNELVRFLPASELLPQTALLVHPGDIHLETRQGHNTFIVYPRSVVPVYPVADPKTHWGKVDPVTGMVLHTPWDEFGHFPAIDERSLWVLFGGESLGSLVRLISDFVGDTYFQKHNIVAYDHRDLAFGVAYVVYDLFTKGGRVVAPDITLMEMQTLATGETPPSLRLLPVRTLQALQTLARAETL